ncbi:MAG: hypothetical protein Q9178_003708 [Gyalolechia marmorata]
MQQPDSMPMVHRFDGHEDQVKEFLWRARGSVEDSTDSRDFQLVSWGTDRVLQLHCLGEDILAKVGHVRGHQVKQTIPFTRRNAPYKSFRGNPSSITKDVDSIFGPSRHNLNIQHNAGMSGLSGIDHSRQALGVNGAWVTTENSLASMAGKKTRSRDDVDAISWMKGVKIGKREPRQAGADQGMSSVLSPALKTSQPWDTFDSLAEEITHLADKFSKVTFENINMDDRQIVLSLHGPWGSGRASVFVKCSIEVPLRYPNVEPPWVTIESTAEMTDESILQATSEVQLIAQAYQERHRHSLEAVLRYLLGEQSYDDTLALLQALPDRSSLGLGLDGQGELSSSDDDDESDHQYANIQVPGLESSDVMVAVSNAQYNVPLPKACGALWADDGRLVCFFPPKDERPPSFMQPLNFKAGEWTSKNRRSLLEGFGKLQSGSSISKMTSSKVSATESGDSDFDDSSESSSESSSSTENRTSHLRLMPTMAWREGIHESTHALSVDESQRSSGPSGLPKSTMLNSKNFVSIRDCAELLPAKRALAVEYQADSTGECCVHNAAVARKYGELDLADIWEFLNLIIQDEVPLERIHISSKYDPILVVARRAVSPLHPKDSAIDLSYDYHEGEHKTRLKGRVYWGAHPFGSRWLVEALFEHFDRLADIQMLAMLSCVLQSPHKNSVNPATARDDRSEAGSSNPLQEISISHPLAAIERYYPFAEAASNVRGPPIKKPQFILEMQKPTSGSQSAGSSFGASTSDPMTPYSTGLTPPSSTKPNRLHNERSLSQIPMSTSPEEYKHTHRSTSNVASTFAASLVRPFSSSTPDSSSPPTTYPRRRMSPAVSYLGAATSNSVWTYSSQRGKTSSSTQTSKDQTSSSLVYDRQSYSEGNGFSFHTKLKNQAQFENDGYAAEPLLDPGKEERYSAYRSAYASMLLAWDLPIVSSKVLQYNTTGPAEHVLQKERNHQRATESLIVVRRDPSSLTAQDKAELQLNFREHCSNCNNVQLPQMVEENTPLISTTNVSTIEDDKSGWHDVAEESEMGNEKPWRRVAYESLARNLGAISLTPKPSQIWRGGEKSKANLNGFPEMRRSGSGSG